MAAGRRYYWPELQLNIWILVVLVGSATRMGIFAWFLTVQAQLELGTPWYADAKILHTHTYLTLT